MINYKTAFASVLVKKALAVLVMLNVGMVAVTGAATAPAETKTSAAPVSARLADGHPDWTGFWVRPGGLLEVYKGPSGVTPPTGTTQGPVNTPRTPGRPFSNHTEVKSPYKERQAEYMKKAEAGLVTDPVALCYPPGMPGMMLMIYGMEVLQTPGQITITSEWQAASRRIWMNQKTHPNLDELNPTYAGHSIGHWEGDTLVVDTIGIRNDVSISPGLLNSGNLHIVERFTQSSPGMLVNEITIDDPEVFVAPWQQLVTYKFRPDLHLEEYTCLENNRNVGANGEAAFK